MYEFYRKYLFHLNNSQLTLLLEELEEYLGPLQKKEMSKGKITVGL
jgi:hypothetical protein